ncbi:hypothetical protein RUM8411_04338 [Ruegeria meonggei]|uniref:Uncharacterized protein n=1 Tax=Ruegeria meonggei TaxID=1446476 RepID=A0A1X7ACL9_9RHOB|nr:hypothetical protein RUM8411_04338 [Ruegeria meonggei]
MVGEIRAGIQCICQATGLDAVLVVPVSLCRCKIVECLIVFAWLEQDVVVYGPAALPIIAYDLRCNILFDRDVLAGQNIDCRNFDTAGQGLFIHMQDRVL